MSVALSWSVASRQDPTSQKVRYLHVKSYSSVLGLWRHNGRHSFPLCPDPMATPCLHHFSSPRGGNWMLLFTEQEMEVQEGKSCPL